MTAAADPLERLSPSARARLGWFTAGLERIRIDDLPLYAVRVRQPDHRRAVEAAALGARKDGVEPVVEAARRTITEYVGRQHAQGPARYGFEYAAGSAIGRPEDWVRVMRSLGDAVTAVVLWDHLDEWVRFELLGEWARLLP